MVNFRDPAVVARTELIRVKFWHVLGGVYIWEFLTTLDYEWRVIRGRIPYRWTIWIYSLTRVSAFMASILCIIGMDSTRQIDCQPWLSIVLVLSYVPVAGASLLIVLRVVAIWDRNRAVMTTTIGLVFRIIQTEAGRIGIVELRSKWVEDTCEPINTTKNTLTIISIAITEVTLLLIMLVGLFRMRHHVGGLGLTNLLWKQGVIWISLAAVSEIPPVVLIVLNLNDQLNLMLQIFSLVTMAIVATRIHRLLVDFASKSSDTGYDNHPASGLALFKAKRTSVMSNPVQVTVDIEQHPASQISLHGTRIDIDVEVHEKPDGLHPHENLEGDPDV